MWRVGLRLECRGRLRSWGQSDDGHEKGWWQVSEGRLNRGHSDREAQFPAPPAGSTLPDWYPELLASVSTRVSTGQRRAIAAANNELLATYWAIGTDILARQGEQGWGAKIIDRLSSDLRARFPDVRGYSPRNLKYMRAFAVAWPDPAIVQRSVAQLPWRHHIALLEKLSHPEERLWYPVQGAGRHRPDHDPRQSVLGVHDRAGFRRRGDVRVQQVRVQVDMS